MKNLSPIDENRDVVTKEYVDNASVSSAEKLTSSAGSSTVPVYFEDGKPKVCAYTLGSMSKESASDYEKAAVTDEKFAAVKNDIALNRTTLGMQCKNLLKNNAVTKTVNGVTFTVNDDKSITVNGTATAQISFRISNKVGLGIGNYILTGCPSGGSWNTFYLTAYASSAWLKSPDFGSGCKIENKTVTQVVISIASGYTANNLKFYPMLRYADITDDTYEPYQPSLVERCLLKDTAGEWLGVSQSGSITIDNLSSYTALWLYVVGNVSGINFTTNLIVPVAYLAKSTSNSVKLAGGIPSSAYITSEGPLAAKDMNGTITAKVSGNTLDLTISGGIIGSVEVISLM